LVAEKTVGGFRKFVDITAYGFALVFGFDLFVDI
jgi:hypothetical protein